MSKQFKVYAAGPIANLTYEESESWRGYVKTHLPPEIVVYSPLRGKQFLKGMGKLIAVPDSEAPLSTPKGINARDHYDLLSCDAVLANLIGTKTISIGTVMEIAWAFAYRKPCIVCMEPGNIHEHGMLRESASFLVPTLDQGVDVITQVLLP